MSAYRWFSEDFHQIRISPETEQELAGRREAGDLDARNQLVEANYAMALRLAYEYRGYRGSCTEDEIISYAMWGLFEVADQYKADFKRRDSTVRFSTLAYKHIKRAIRRAVIQEAGLIRIPEGVQHAIWKESRARARGESPPERKTGVAEARHARHCLAHGMAISPTEYDPLNDLDDGIDDSESLDDGLPDVSALEPALQWLAKTHPQYAAVLRLGYGLNSSRTRMAFRDVALQIGCNWQYVFRMRDRGLVLLREYFETQERLRIPRLESR